MKIVIVGCGRLGSGLAYVLANRGDEVSVVDINPCAFERLGTGFKGKTVQGVGFDGETLLEAGIRDADALAAVTSSDEVNVVAARIASQFFHVPKVVARLYEPSQEDNYLNLGVQIFSTVEWGIQRVVDLFDYKPTQVVSSLGTGEVDILERTVPEELVGRLVSELSFPGELSVVAVSRAGKTHLPLPEEKLESGDTVHLAVLDTAGNRLKTLFAQ